MSGPARTITTPFGERPLVYADHVASGRPCADIDAAIAALAKDYANPHSEDAELARRTRAAMSEAEARIRRVVNAGPEDMLIACGDGATGAIYRLQQILGVAIAPATRAFLDETLRAALGGEAGRVHEEIARRRPVVFIGPYEHHSNELSWRESLAEIVRIGLDASGGIDFDELEARLSDPAFAGRARIGAFSAASNVTGIRTDTVRLARLLHAHGAILCLDAAASAPYQRIDMHPEDDETARVDAVYLSPHKLPGGPGACGILLLNRALYRNDLPPTISGGGTVRYVTASQHDYIEGAEPRERAGTPGVLQLVRASLALSRIEAEGYDTIERREQAVLKRAFARWTPAAGVEILGPLEPERRLAIVSMNLSARDGTPVHPRLAATALNDLFGIQARAGCACAGPYAHDLLGLDEEATQAARTRVLAGEASARPGWLRIGLHWSLSEAEIDYLIDAVLFIARHGRALSALYRQDVKSGAFRLTEPSARPAGSGANEDDRFAAPFAAAREIIAACRAETV